LRRFSGIEERAIDGDRIVRTVGHDIEADVWDVTICPTESGRPRLERPNAPVPP
jgi:hypothetical protein